ncbi:MAG TPA: choice-of-anchor J domain-containing protein, partial [Povalibacter sp.]|nr:choice-of-anchor J domain-containing protein [Povalibacter sp.]
NGWVLTNNSTPGGLTGWFQGNDGVFPSYSGADNSYIAGNWLNAGPGGNISNWLLTPEVALVNESTLTFFTRSSGFLADRLEVRMSQNGASTNVGTTDSSVGDFTTLLATLNVVLDPAGYPTDWTQISLTLSGLGDGVTGRLAFRYAVTDTNANGDYIGIDSFFLRVPEPGTLALLITGLLGVAVSRRSRVLKR